MFGFGLFWVFFLSRVMRDHGEVLHSPYLAPAKGSFENLRASVVSFHSLHLAAQLIAKLQPGTVSKSELHSLDEAMPHSAAHLLLFDDKRCL